MDHLAHLAEDHRDHLAAGRRNHLAGDHLAHLAEDHRDHLEAGHPFRLAEDHLAGDHRDRLEAGHPFHPAADHRDRLAEDHRDHLAEDHRDHLAEDHRAADRLRLGSHRHRGRRPWCHLGDRPGRLDLAHLEPRGRRVVRPRALAGQVRRPERAAQRRASCLSATVWAQQAAQKLAAAGPQAAHSPSAWCP